MLLVDCLATDRMQPLRIIYQFLKYKEVTSFILGLVHSADKQSEKKCGVGSQEKFAMT